METITAETKLTEKQIEFIAKAPAAIMAQGGEIDGAPRIAEGTVYINVSKVTPAGRKRVCMMMSASGEVRHQAL